MSDLSRSLPEAAWVEMAGPAWRNVTYADLSDADPDTVMSGMKARVDRTVAAVLETLAARAHWLKPDNSDGFVTAVEVNEALRRLAVETRASEGR